MTNIIAPRGFHQENENEYRRAISQELEIRPLLHAPNVFLANQAAPFLDYGGEKINVMHPQFRVVGNGVADDTVGLQAALDKAADLNAVVVSPPGKTYRFSTLRIHNGVRGVILNNCTLVPDSSTAGVTTGALQLDGPEEFGGTAVSRCWVSVRMDMSNGGRTAVFADGCTDCTFTDCDIYGFTNHATQNHYGLRFWYDSARNSVYNNKIEGYDTPTQRGLLIQFVGNDLAFAGYYLNSGVISRSTVPCTENIIHGNTLINGSYGVTLLGGERCMVYGNTCKGQNHRSIYMAEACWGCVVANNDLTDFTSSAIIVAYGCAHNIIIGNNCRRETGYLAAGTGEAVINVFLGAKYNQFINNRCYADVNYGIYLACDVQHNLVQGNEVENYYLAGIALENDWQDISLRPAGANYSKPNVADISTITEDSLVYAFNDTHSNTIKGNTVRVGAASRVVAAIYMAQVDALSDLSTDRNAIVDNEVYGDATMGFYVKVFEETSGRCIDNKLSGNRYIAPSGMPDTSKVAFTRGRSHFTQVYGNDVFDFTQIRNAFADGDTTPSVSLGGVFSAAPEAMFLCANTGATSITDFDDGYNGQEITIRLDTNTTIVHAASLIRLLGEQNITGATSNYWVKLKQEQGVWFEVARNFPLWRLPTTHTANVTSTTADFDRVYRFDCTSGNLTHTIPAAAARAGMRLTARKVDATANTLTISVSGGGTIDGAGSQVLGTQWDTARLISNGSSWDLI